MCFCMQTHKGIVYSSFKREEILTICPTWMMIDDTIPSEINLPNNTNII